MKNNKDEQNRDNSQKDEVTDVNSSEIWNPDSLNIKYEIKKLKNKFSKNKYYKIIRYNACQELLNPREKYVVKKIREFNALRHFKQQRKYDVMNAKINDMFNKIKKINKRFDLINSRIAGINKIQDKNFEKNINNKINNKIFEFKIALNEEDDCKFFLKNRINKNLKKRAQQIFREYKKNQNNIRNNYDFQNQEEDDDEKELDNKINKMNEDIKKIKELSITDTTTVTDVKQNLEDIKQIANKNKNNDFQILKESEYKKLLNENENNEINSKDKNNENEINESKKCDNEHGNEVIVMDHEVDANEYSKYDLLFKEFPPHEKYELKDIEKKINQEDIIYAKDNVNEALQDVRELEELDELIDDNDINKAKICITLTNQIMDITKFNTIEERKPINIISFLYVIKERYIRIKDMCTTIPEDFRNKNADELQQQLVQLKNRIFEDLHFIIK